MKIETTYCDICKKEMTNPNENINLLSNKIKITFASNSTLEYEDVCSACLKKVLNTIEDLKEE